MEPTRFNQLHTITVKHQPAVLPTQPPTGTHWSPQPTCIITYYLYSCPANHCPEYFSMPCYTFPNIAVQPKDGLRTPFPLTADDVAVRTRHAQRRRTKVGMRPLVWLFHFPTRCVIHSKQVLLVSTWMEACKVCTYRDVQLV